MVDFNCTDKLAAVKDQNSRHPKTDISLLRQLALMHSYQAGADPHIDDPLGGILTTRQMSERDRAVIERLGHLPLVWNLAGGYQAIPGAQRRPSELNRYLRCTAKQHDCTAIFWNEAHAMSLRVGADVDLTQAADFR